MIAVVRAHRSVLGRRARIPADSVRTSVVTASGLGRVFCTPHVFRLEHGRIAEHWAVRDDLGMMQQLGVLPPPG